MTFVSLFAGIGGFDLGLERAGMLCALQVEKDASCRSVLHRRWPHVPKQEDVRGVENIKADLICGGFPCQDVSIAGRRAGLAGGRSGLWFEFLRVLQQNTPAWVIIENVPGLLSSSRGRDFTRILHGLSECGYMSAWRILDAQYFGLAQRRKRLFVVASLGNGCCAQVLFERESGNRNTTTIREKGTIAPTLFASGAGTSRTAASGSEADFVIPVWQEKPNGGIIPPLNAGDYRSPRRSQQGDIEKSIIDAMGVRRLTPIEVARLQGFPDDWNDHLSDTRRYMQYGNAVAVPVAEWIGKRIMEQV